MARAKLAARSLSGSGANTNSSSLVKSNNDARKAGELEKKAKKYKKKLADALVRGTVWWHAGTLCGKTLCVVQGAQREWLKLLTAVDDDWAFLVVSCDVCQHTHNHPAACHTLPCCCRPRSRDWRSS